MTVMRWMRMRETMENMDLHCAVDGDVGDVGGDECDDCCGYCCYCCYC